MKIYKRLTVGRYYVLNSSSKCKSEFVCLEVYPRPSAKLQSVMSKYVFIANGTQLNDDGTIEWDYGTVGHFEE